MTRPNGLTLLELILALFLFATIVPIFAGIWAMNHRAIRKNTGVMAGNHICHLVLEQAIASGFEGVDVMVGTDLSDRTITLSRRSEDSSTGVPVESQSSVDYVWNIEVKTPAQEPTLLAGEKLVEVEVEWDMAGRPQKAEMSTLMVDSP